MFGQYSTFPPLLLNHWQHARTRRYFVDCIGRRDPSVTFTQAIASGFRNNVHFYGRAARMLCAARAYG
jgi:hypothetical protein